MKNQLASKALLMCLVGFMLHPAMADTSTIMQRSIQQVQKTTNDSEVARLQVPNAVLIASKEEDAYRGFVIKWNGIARSFSDWENVLNPAYGPKMYATDLDEDDQSEIIIVLTTGYGTGLLEQKVHVLDKSIDRMGHEVYSEVPVDDPMSIVLKNVRTNLSSHLAQINIGKQVTNLNIDKLHIQPDHRFPDVSFGNLIRFHIIGNQLIALIGAQISPAGGYIGDVKIIYGLKDKMYQAKQIEVIPEKAGKAFISLVTHPQV